MRLTKVAEILLMILSVFSLVSDYAEDADNGCFKFSSFIISISILIFTFVYSKYLIKG